MKFNLDYRKAILIVLAGLILYYRQHIAAALLPFVVGFIIAGMMDPAIDFLEKRLRMPRSMAVIVVMIVGLSVTGYVLTIVVSKIAYELVDLAKFLPVYRHTISDISADLITRLQNFNQNLPEIVNVNIQQSLEDFLRVTESLVRETINRTLAMVASLPTKFVILIIIVLSTYFFAKDRDLMSESLLRLAPEAWRKPIREGRDRAMIDLIGFIKAQLLLMTITTIIATVGFLLMGSRYWMLLALLIGILDVIPVIGPGLILYPWAAVSFFLGDPRMGVNLLILFGIIFLVRQLFQAKILGVSVGVHPLLMLFAIWAGLVLFGVKGILVGPVLVIIGKAILSGRLSAQKAGA